MVCVLVLELHSLHHCEATAVGEPPCGQNSCFLFVLIFFFSSWEAHLASMYSRSQQSATSSFFHPAGTFWSSSPLFLHSQLDPSPVYSRAPPGGVVNVLSVSKASTPFLLSVSEFSVLLTFVTPGNRQTTVVLWDLESRRVSYHRAEGEAAPVQLCGERQHRLLLKSKFNIRTASPLNTELVLPPITKAGQYLVCLLAKYLMYQRTDFN